MIALSRAYIFILTAIVIASGLILRKVPLGLPLVVTKWGGSWLWGAMIWCIVAIPLRQKQPVWTAVAAMALACATECLKCVHMPGLDTFRTRSPLGFLLGRHFAVANLAVYGLSIVTMAVAFRPKVTNDDQRG